MPNSLTDAPQEDLNKGNWARKHTFKVLWATCEVAAGPIRKYTCKKGKEGLGTLSTAVEK